MTGDRIEQWTSPKFGPYRGLAIAATNGVMAGTVYSLAASAYFIFTTSVIESVNRRKVWYADVEALNGFSNDTGDGIGHHKVAQASEFVADTVYHSTAD